MYYVYHLQSLSVPNERYTGFTEDLKNRLAAHNRGECAHTRKHMPWELIGYHALRDKSQAVDFEIYLKSGSGRALANKRLWPK